MSDSEFRQATNDRVVDLFPLEEIAANSARRADVDGHRLAVIRFDDEVHVIGDECSHADYSLAEGEVDSEDRTLECFKHGSTFSVDTGEPTCLPATRPVPVYEVSVEDGMIRVTISVPIEGATS